jgi:aminoacyl tRNA synthase complex-interacting multifunctional protein 1
MGRGPSRDQISDAVAKCLFVKPSQQDRVKLLEIVGPKVDWEVVRKYTQAAVRSPAAAATLSSHYTAQLAVLDAVLEPQLFLGGTIFCFADLALCIALHACFAAFDDAHKWALCNASRWYDLLQHRVKELIPPEDLRCASLVAFNYTAPDPLPSVASLSPIVGAATAAPAAAAVASSPAPAPAPASSGDAGGRPPVDEATKAAAKAKKEAEKAEKAAKKEAKASAPGAGESAGAAEERAVDVSWLDIRVGLITQAEAHPESDKLYIETIDVGEEAPRQVLSGLAQHLPIEAVRGARVLVLCNLGAKKLGGVESQGMVLCAKNDSALCFVTPPAGAQPGARVSFEGYPGEPEPNPKRIQKKKAWEACMPELAVSADGVACYKGVPFALPEGHCTATVKGAPIS